MRCDNCKNWLTQRVTDYEDGTRIVNYSSPDGKGKCEALNLETAPDFGCNKFIEGHDHIEIMGKKSGSPWQHSQWGLCPDCKGTGWGCKRCAGTGRVLHYDDGYVGEEQTRRHPKELEGHAPLPPPKCVQCSHDMDPHWVACPYCGFKKELPADPVRVSEVL